MNKHGEIHVTCGSRGEAVQIADALIARRLAACVHLAPIDSVYEWKGVVEHDEEISLNAKTRSALFDRIAAVIDELHGYDLPAITMTPMSGSPDYLAWIDEQTTPPTE